MIQTSMLDIARNGQAIANCLRLGHHELCDLVGNPSDWDANHALDRARIWRYGDIEFHFNDHRVYLVFSDHKCLTDGGRSIEIEPWIIRRGLSREQFESALRGEVISFLTIEPNYNPSHRLVTTESGATFTFVEDSDDDVSGLISWSIQTRAEQDAAGNPLPFE